MTRYSRWAQTERLYREALLRHETERAVFLAEACRGDVALYDEVAALLEPDDALDQPPAADARNRFPVIAVVVSMAALALFLVAAIAVVRVGDRTVEFEYETSGADGSPITARVRPHRTRALDPEDVIVAFDGDRRITRLDAVYFQRFVRLDGSHTVTIVKDGREQQVAIRAVFGTSREQWLLCLSLLIAALASFVVAALIAVYRPEFAVSRFAFAAGIALGLYLLWQTRGFTMPWLSEPWRSLMLVVFPINPLHLAICYDFFTRFPPGVTITPFWRRVRVGLYAVCALLAVPGSLLNAVVLPLGRDAYVSARYLLVSVDRWLYFVELMIFPAAGLAMLAIVARNYRAVRSSVDRRRLGWVLWSTVAGLTPFLAIELVRVAATLVGVEVNLMPWIIPGNLATAAIPIGFGYAIIKHQLFDIRVVVRRGIKYLLAINALRILLLLPVSALVYGIVADRDQPIGRLLLSNSIYVYLIGMVFLSLRFRTQLTRWVDRRFFREAYDRERILLELIESADKLESASEVSRLVSRDLELALHPRCLFIWHREGKQPNPKLVYSSGGYIHRHEIAADSPLAILVARQAAVVELPMTTGEMTAADRLWLADAGVRLIVPMVGSDQHLSGLVMLGDKKSEEPYSADDRQLLLAIARQIAAAQENIRLKQRVNPGPDAPTLLPRGKSPELKECPKCGACYDDVATTCASDGSALAASLSIERTIDGKYRLDRKIGRGGMGAVYEAVDLRLARSVAVKILLGQSLSDQEALRRFEREAQVSARLAHPNIVTVFDFGRTSHDGAFLVMELVRGQTMRAVLEDRGRMTGMEIVSWFEQICVAAAVAHQQGIVHRDLKPENILIGRTGGTEVVKVLDFGLAAITGRDSFHQTLTHPGTIMGTPGYMAPEQLTGGTVDQRSDIFAIGVMVTEAISGRPLFTGRTRDEILMAIVHQPLQLEGAGRERRRLEAVLQRAVAKAPDARFPTVTEFASELLPALRCQPVN